MCAPNSDESVKRLAAASLVAQLRLSFLRMLARPPWSPTFVRRDATLVAPILRASSFQSSPAWCRRCPLLVLLAPRGGGVSSCSATSPHFFVSEFMPMLPRVSLPVSRFAHCRQAVWHPLQRAGLFCLDRISRRQHTSLPYPDWFRLPRKDWSVLFSVSESVIKFTECHDFSHVGAVSVET